MKKSINKNLLFMVAITIGLSLNGFSQKCAKFIDYQNKVINTKGLSLQASGIPVNLAPINISTIHREASERLQMLDMLQYNLCQKMNNIKIPVLKETMDVEYSNFLKEMMQMLVGETDSGKKPEPITSQPEISQKDLQPVDPEPVTPEPITPEPVTPVAGGKIRITFPCRITDQSGSSDGVIRAFGMEESADAQIAREIAHTVARAELAAKIEITVKSTIDFCSQSNKTGLTEEFEKRYEMKTTQSVEQTLKGYKTVCEEFEQDVATSKYTCYVVLEISEEKILPAVYDELTKDTEIKKTISGYEEFKGIFKKVEDLRKGNSLYLGI